MPKVSRKPLSKDIDIVFEGETWRVEIFKHYSPSDIYLAIHKVIPLASEIRLTDENGTLLELRYEILKTTSKIFAHRSEHLVQGPASHSKVAKKVNALLGKVMTNWGVNSVEEILPLDLAPRVRPFGGEEFATQIDIDAGIAVRNPCEWPGKFVVALYDLSKVTIKAQAEAVALLHASVAERKATKDAQFKKVFEVMTADIRKVVEERKEELAELANEGINVALFAGVGEGGMVEEIEKIEAEQDKVQQEKPHTWEMTVRRKGEDE